MFEYIEDKNRMKTAENCGICRESMERKKTIDFIICFMIR
ncbi:hypothetical protein SAMN05421659_12716 [[Clostridium] fimetarium]|uniref:Uncharacterized protein n=1 Tax=[Clostridium] fimetarium TaxID=99656 RepID=A0A1I0RWB7_9FIRM|nr:hypothetical protein SAMN05421659_12716 [[Clostridium] fimetarium]